MTPTHPAATQTPDKALVEIDGERCKGCELCVVVCPMGCLDLDRSLFNSSGFHPARFLNRGAKGSCTACGICYMVCPDYAVKAVKRLGGRAKPDP